MSIQTEYNMDVLGVKNIEDNLILVTIKITGSNDVGVGSDYREFAIYDINKSDIIEKYRTNVDSIGIRVETVPIDSDKFEYLIINYNQISEDDIKDIVSNHEYYINCISDDKFIRDMDDQIASGFVHRHLNLVIYRDFFDWYKECGYCIDEDENDVNKILYGKPINKCLDEETIRRLVESRKKSISYKRYLSNTDWIVSKISENQISGFDVEPLKEKYHDILSKRKEAREFINNAE